ncbi:MAG: hypothetical protein M3169_16300 [Candidatus Eremiobacteraeota bacterium]|nr:hypothetical protein [Candidatus Eremiobacteraeota bacterium]
MAARTKAVVVAIGGPHQDLKHAQGLLAQVLKDAGCGGCISGFDIHLINEGELFAHNVQVNAKQIQVGP